MRLHFAGNLVTFQNMLQRSDLDIVILEYSEESKNFVLPIAVAMDPTFAAKNFCDRIEFEIASRR
jgi:hypothetical protein